MTDAKRQYVLLKSKGMVMGDRGGYDLRRGEMNPAVFEEFAGMVLESGLAPAIWEPFAGHTGRSRNQDFVSDIDGLELISFDVEPCDERVTRADSTKEGPGRFVGGVFFHPPYFGSMRMSKAPGEISAERGESGYMEMLKKAAGLARMSLEAKGLLCAVGRDYRHDGRRIRLDLWMMGIFEEAGMELVEVWQSEPDVALILEAKDV